MHAMEVIKHVKHSFDHVKCWSACCSAESSLCRPGLATRQRDAEVSRLQNDDKWAHVELIQGPHDRYDLCWYSQKQVWCLIGCSGSHHATCMHQVSS